MPTQSSTVRTDRAPIAILGVPFDNVTIPDALALTGAMIESGRPHYATAVGVDFLVQSLDDVEVRHILFDAHLVLAEEKRVVWASKILGNPLPENISTLTFVSQLLTLAEQKNWRVFLLGADEAGAEKIRSHHPKLPFVGAYLPPEKPLLEMDQADIRRRLREAKPNILLVDLGCPKQEKWISMSYREAGVPFTMGASFPALTGAAKAPQPHWKIFVKFVRAVLSQWWGLRSKEKVNPAVADAIVKPDTFGNLVIRAPDRLGAAEVQVAQTEWLLAVANSHVFFDLSDTVLIDSTGVGMLIRLRKRAREGGFQFILIAPRPPVEAALKLMKLEAFFTIQASMAGARILMESAAGAPVVTSGVREKNLSIRWNGEVTAHNAIELGAYTEAELSQVSPGMEVVIDLSRVTFVDSTGIGLMVRFKKNLKRQDIRLTFTNVSDSVRNVTQQTQLAEFLLGAN